MYRSSSMPSIDNTAFGVLMCSFIKSRRSIPPALSVASPLAYSESAASVCSATKYSKGIIASLPGERLPQALCLA